MNRRKKENNRTRYVCVVECHGVVLLLMIGNWKLGVQTGATTGSAYARNGIRARFENAATFLGFRGVKPVVVEEMSLL